MAIEEKHATATNPEPLIAKLSQADLELVSEREAEEFSNVPEDSKSSYLHGWKLHLTTLRQESL